MSIFRAKIHCNVYAWYSSCFRQEFVIKQFHYWFEVFKLTLTCDEGREEHVDTLENSSRESKENEVAVLTSLSSACSSP